MLICVSGLKDTDRDVRFARGDVFEAEFCGSRGEFSASDAMAKEIKGVELYAVCH